VIAAQVLKQGGLVDRVGILDIDCHYGDGTDDIIKHLGLDYIKHWTFGQQGYFRRDGGAKFIGDLPEVVRSFGECDVLLYQAGADPHVNDPLGGVLTTEELRKRDEIVFTICRELGLPVAWNLAGGYQKPLIKVLEIHDNTARECVRAYRE
jgi:acetoin utilization deacetylase AcuC-like enzyme